VIDRAESMSRLAQALDVPVEQLDAGSDRPANAEGPDVVTLLGREIAAFRQRHLLTADHVLTVTLGSEVVRYLEQRGELHDDGDDELRYVVVHGTKVRVDEVAYPVADVTEGLLDGLRDGARPRAPHTGPARPAFARRGRR